MKSNNNLTAKSSEFLAKEGLCYLKDVKNLELILK